MAYSRALYFAAILPPEAVKQEIEKMKLEFKEKYGSSHALKLPAHITLIPPIRLEKEQELPFLNNVRKVAAEQFVFPVKLKDFGHFGHRVIFLKVADHALIKELYQKLLQALQGILQPTEIKDLHPHITIATRDLARDNFKIAWPELKERSYEAQFYATAITLFKNDGKTWDAVENLPFQEKSLI